MGCLGPLTHAAGSLAHSTGTVPPPRGKTFSSFVCPVTLHLYMLLYCRQLVCHHMSPGQPTISSPYPSPLPA